VIESSWISIVPPFPHGVPRIGAKVHEDLVNLGRVPEDHVLSILDRDSMADMDGGREKGAHEFHDLFYDRGEHDRLCQLLGSAAEGEDLFDEVLGAVYGLEDLVKAVLHLGLVCHLKGYDLRVAA